MSSERTERATPKRRRDARRRGEVPRSTELTAAVALLGVTVFFRWYGPYLVHAIGNMMRGTFEELHQPDLSPALLQGMLLDSGIMFATALAPLLGVVLVVGIASSVAQGGFVFAPTLLKPDFKRINPATGLKRIFSKRGAFDTAKSLIKLTIIAAVTYPLVRAKIEEFAALTGADPIEIGAAVGAAVSELAVRAGSVYLILAAIDYAYQRWEYESKLRMTLQEVKEELRTTEGSPEIKSRIRSIQRQIARRRMMSDIPTATVVLTNPTHLAVALRFDMYGMAAPVVVAKGAGTVAERIKTIARQHGILVMENKPLARALYESVEVGTEIPVALYEAVADVIAYVYRIRMRTA